jgi:hypothetical protein
MQTRIAVFAFALSIAATGTLFASEIYKWTDAEGGVHFSDRPVVGAEHLSIRSRSTDPARVQSRVQSRIADQARREEETANAPQGPTAEERRSEARERQEKCNEYRDRQVRFTQNRRIYKMENGERVYYDDEEMQVARTNVDDLVRKYCN